MSDLVVQTVALGAPPWPTVDPFLFCVHHLDAYPAGNERLGPAASLAGRQLGQDFAGRDGWSMYHGRVVPGFPQHPHRGFETITYARQGLIDHSDSLGAAARFGRGDVQWMTAGGGIVHSEMFPLVRTDGPNPTELFQIWLNLPAADKLVEPHFAMLWDSAIPRHVVIDGAGRSAEVTVIAGGFGPDVAREDVPAPPPSSWASRPDTDVAIWHLRIEPGAALVLPPAAGPDTVRTMYVFEGGSLLVGHGDDGRAGAGGRGGDGHRVDRGQAAVLRAEVAAPLRASTEGGPGPVEALVLQGRPIGEPVAQYGPFVMNDKAGIQRAFDDYQRTGFGGWPWLSDDPVHGPDRDRFARHADGRTEERPSTPAPA
jgi:quercetin 2,3-dioxygenase